MQKWGEERWKSLKKQPTETSSLSSHAKLIFNLNEPNRNGKQPLFYLASLPLGKSAHCFRAGDSCMLKNWRHMLFSMTEAGPLSTSPHLNHFEQFGTPSNLTHQREYKIGTESGILTMVWFHLRGSANGPRAMYSLCGKSIQPLFLLQSLH